MILDFRAMLQDLSFVQTISKNHTVWVANRNTIDEVSFVNDIQWVIQTFGFVAKHRHLMGIKIGFTHINFHLINFSIAFFGYFSCD